MFLWWLSREFRSVCYLISDVGEKVLSEWLTMQPLAAFTRTSVSYVLSFPLLQGSTESVNGGCKDCRIGEESVSCGEVMVTNEGSSCSCPAASILGSPKVKKGTWVCM